MFLLILTQLRLDLQKEWRTVHIHIYIYGREEGRREKTKLHKPLTLFHKEIGAKEVAPE